MNLQRIKELREELDNERISYVELAEIDVAGVEARLNIYEMTASDVLNELETRARAVTTGDGKAIKVQVFTKEQEAREKLDNALFNYIDQYKDAGATDYSTFDEWLEGEVGFSNPLQEDN